MWDKKLQDIFKNKVYCFNRHSHFQKQRIDRTGLYCSHKFLRKWFSKTTIYGLRFFLKRHLVFFKPKDCKANLFVKPKPSKLQTIGPTVNWARNGSKFSYQTDWSFWTMDQSIYYLQEKYILWRSTDRSINPRLDPLDLKHLYISNCLVTHYFHLWFVVGGQIYNRISKKIHEPSILSFSLIRQLVFLIFLRLPIFIMWG